VGARRLIERICGKGEFLNMERYGEGVCGWWISKLVYYTVHNKRNLLVFNEINKTRRALARAHVSHNNGAIPST